MRNRPVPVQLESVKSKSAETNYCLLMYAFVNSSLPSLWHFYSRTSDLHVLHWLLWIMCLIVCCSVFIVGTSAGVARSTLGARLPGGGTARRRAGTERCIVGQFRRASCEVLWLVDANRGNLVTDGGRGQHDGDADDYWTSSAAQGNSTTGFIESRGEWEQIFVIVDR